MEKAIKKLEILVGDFDFMLQDGFIMSDEEYEHAKNLAKQLNETIRDFYLSDPKYSAKRSEMFIERNLNNND